MATNLVHFGRTRKIAVDSGITSGDPVLVGVLSGVALTDRDSDGNAVVDFGAPLASYDLSVKAVNDAGNSAVAVGDELFTIVADTPDLSKKASGNSYGAALEAVTSGATATIEVLLLPGVGSGTADVLAGAIGTSELAAGALAASATGRAIMADAFFDAATALAKFGPDSLTNAVLLDAVQDGAFVADAATRALFADKFLPAAKANVFVSAEQTATGSAQNVAHGLTGTPSAVLIVPTELPAGLAAGMDIAEGTHDATNVVVTVTATVKFKVFAWV